MYQINHPAEKCSEVIRYATREQAISHCAPKAVVKRVRV